MSTAEHLVGLVWFLAVVAGPVVAAVVARRALVPGWAGAPARLVESLLAVGGLVLLSQALGLVGLLDRGPLVVAGLVLAVASVGVARRAGPAAPLAPPGLDRQDAVPWTPRDRRVVGAAVAATAVTVLGAQASAVLRGLRQGIAQIESLHYHLPHALHMAQTGRAFDLVAVDTGYGTAFHPATAELVQAVGIEATGDVGVGLLLNSAWTALALLAAWCCGSTARSSAACLVGVAAVLSAPFVAVVYPASAMNDPASLALLLAAVALLRPGAASRRGAALVGLALGLAVSVKLIVAPAAGLLLLLLTWRRRGRRDVLAWLWGAAALAGSAWFLRNLVVAGSPVPALGLDVVGLAAPELPALEADDASVLQRVGEPAFRTQVPGDLRLVFGVLGPVVPLLALLAAGAAAAGRHVPARTRAVAVAALASALVYVLTPTSGGEAGRFLFVSNVRYLLPALALGLVAAPAVPWVRRHLTAWTAALAVLHLVAVLPREYAWAGPRPVALALGVGLLVAAVVVGLALLRARRATRAAAAAVAVPVAVVAWAVLLGVGGGLEGPPRGTGTTTWRTPSPPSTRPASPSPASCSAGPSPARTWTARW